MDRIKEIFVPETVTTPEQLVVFIADEVRRRGGDPATVRFIDTASAIPNVQHSEEWPCLTLQYDDASTEPRCLNGDDVK